MMDAEVVAQLLIEQLRSKAESLFNLVRGIPEDVDTPGLFKPVLSSLNVRLDSVRGRVTAVSSDEMNYDEDIWGNLLSRIESLYDIGGYEIFSTEESLRCFLAIEMLLPILERKGE